MLKTINIFKYSIALVILIAAFLSYNYNAFNVISDPWFDNFPGGSEELVTDGMHYAKNNNTTPILGRYSRPNLDQKTLSTEYLAHRSDYSGVFVHYKSQFGLQPKVFGLLYDKGYNLYQLQTLAAATTAVVVMLIFLVLASQFSLTGAAVFAAILILSPWTIIFARSLYWVFFLWLMPFLASLYLSKNAIISNKEFILLFLSLFVLLTLRFLCGYEYITTIVIAAFIPFLYQALKQNLSLWRLLTKTAILSLSALFAFVLSVTLHISSISESFDDGFDNVYQIAGKRLAASDNIFDMDKVAEEACIEYNGSEACKDTIKESLTASSLKVMVSYLVMFDFLPWVSKLEFQESDEMLISDVYRTPSITSITNLITNINFAIIAKSLAVVAFLLFLTYALIRAAKTDRKTLLVFLAALAAPISWYFIGKGHSYIHKHINYVLWYIPTIPLGALIIIESFKKNSTNE